MDSSGNLYTSNWVDHTISKFNSSGIFQMTIGSPSNLNYPWGLATDQPGNLYASNGGMNTISKFDSAGNYLSVGSISTNLSNPMGIAIDSSGNLFSANNGNNTISQIHVFLEHWNCIAACDRHHPRAILICPGLHFRRFDCLFETPPKVGTSEIF
jgi:DNA-binding beta-propeller fold protein YncE